MENANAAMGAYAAMMPIFYLISLAIYVLVAIPMMKIGNDKGLTGWFAWIPILNVVLLLQIAGKPIWWIILMLIPIVNIFIIIFTLIAFFKAIGKSPAWTWAILFSPLLLIPIYSAAFGKK